MTTVGPVTMRSASALKLHHDLCFVPRMREHEFQDLREDIRTSGILCPLDVLNDVVLNQVLVSFGGHAKTRRVIAEVQRDGTCWCGGTEWQGHAAMRISVSCWATTEDDVDRSLAAILRIAAAIE